VGAPQTPMLMIAVALVGWLVVEAAGPDGVVSVGRGER